MFATLPRRAFLGAELPADHEAFSDEGLVIAGVMPGGMAERAGIEPGDVVTSLAGVRPRNLCELAAALRLAGASATTEIVVRRGSTIFTRAVAVTPLPLETVYGAELAYTEIPAVGARLRAIATRSPAPHALVLVVQGIACETVDQPAAAGVPLCELIRGWSRAGLDTLRFDKRGVGDSEGGPCHATDFATELADARAALELAMSHARERDVPLFVFGHSVGGIIAPLIASDGPVAGVIVYGSPVMRWIDCLLDSAERQLVALGAHPDEIAARRDAIRALARTGELNGRSAAYHAQLDGIDLAPAWATVASPVLVLRGEHDWVVRPDDQGRIAELRNGDTTIIDLPGLDHLLGAHRGREASLRDYGQGAFDPAIVEATMTWIRRRI